jgi:hypothetical protein
LTQTTLTIIRLVRFAIAIPMFFGGFITGIYLAV